MVYVYYWWYSTFCPLRSSSSIAFGEFFCTQFHTIAEVKTNCFELNFTTITKHQQNIPNGNRLCTQTTQNIQYSIMDRFFLCVCVCEYVLLVAM